VLNFKKIVSGFCVGLALLIAGHSTATAQVTVASDSFVVSDIRIEGLQGVSPSRVFDVMPVKIGDVVTSGSVTFEGNKEFKDPLLNQVMEDNKLAPGDVLKTNLLSRIVQELKNQYLNVGKYNAEVNTKITPLGNSRVNVGLVIDEGKTAKVEKITIIGNQHFSNAQILRRFESKTSRGLNPFGASNLYSKAKMSGDIEKLRSMYQDAGFADFEIDSSRVTISPNKDGVFVALNVSEGKRYTVKQFALNGRLVVPESELLPLVAIRPGSYFVQSDVEKTVSSISEVLADEGYAKARVSPVPSFDKAAGTVSFAININPGKTVYVRRIEITGNEKTSDEVIRRELRQIEGASLSPSSVRLSKERLQWI